MHFLCCDVKSLQHIKNFEAGRVPYLGLELTIHIMKIKIHLGDSPFQQTKRLHEMTLALEKHN
jgi:hypothetical protein